LTSILKSILWLQQLPVKDKGPDLASTTPENPRLNKNQK